jgi:2-dehydropantoate 2-reductase
MNIVIFGAGAIGSLFGSLLSRNNNVILISRKPHVRAIRKNGLTIEDKTKLNVEIDAEESIDKIKTHTDLFILTVKSYDTENAIKEAGGIIDDNTIVLSVQNGLDNIDKIKKFVDSKNIIACVTTHGAFFEKPGLIKHTGIGKTIIGELNGDKSERLSELQSIFNNSDIKTTISSDIFKELWIKTIVNSSINPLTSIFNCKNGYLLENPVLEKIVEKVCKESTDIANANGISLSYFSMIKKTKEVINGTAENFSSMLQSIQKGKKTEINSINGKLVELGKKCGIEPTLNEILIYSVKSL